MRCAGYRLFVGLVVISLASTGCPDSQQTDNDGGEHTVDPSGQNGTDPLAPDGVTATEGDDPEAVVVEWERVDDAEGYLVVRDGDQEFERGANETELVDDDADPPQEPEAPYDLEASESEGYGVIVNWEFDTPEPGTEHEYVVHAIIDGETTGGSESAVGWRGPYSYEFEVHSDHSSEWHDAGTQRQYIDDQAPYGDLLDAGSARASQGTHVDRVHLNIEGLETTAGPAVDYRVRVDDGHHEEVTSPTVTGRRGPAVPDVQWERSSGDEPLGFEEVEAGTAVPFNDLNAPADGEIRYWRADLEFPDGDQVLTTESDWGFRAIDCAVDDDFEGEFDDEWYEDFAPTALTTSSVFDDGASLQALWNATNPAYNDASPQELTPPMVVEGATVTATTFRQNQQFWIQDDETAIHVYLSDEVGEDIEVGQRVSFAATEISVFNGNPEVTDLEDFNVVSEGHPVGFTDMRTDEITIDDHHYEIVRVGGRLDNSRYCGAGFTCFDLTYGPVGSRQSVEFRTADDDIKEGGCVTYVGPVSGFLGPKHPEDNQAPQLQDDRYMWSQFTEN